jgi:hypothetical protein
VLRRRHRVLAPLLVAALCVSQVAVAMHAPAATHARCEHGQLIDAPVTTSAERAIAPATDAAVAPAPRGGHQTSHEHCPLSTLMRQASLAATCALAVPVSTPAILEPIAPQPPSPPPCRLAIYRLAPKTSPPA